MCGIFGSNNKNSFFDLYQLNRSRGSYSSGVFCFRDSTSVVYKTNKAITFNDIPDNMDYYLGHNRAPTIETTSFAEHACHPFQTDYYWYAHNGIINNHKELLEKYEKHYTVDSEWIGFYLEKHHLIKDALEEISNNPFAVWILRREHPYSFTLARVANPIYKSTENNSFSSAQFEGSKLIEEGTVYAGTADKITNTLLKFKHKSPYFIPG
jgi:glucosamine 6-phosphate synthetase-like amidotransferase/phosphosugar isomerase protein